MSEQRQKEIKELLQKHAKNQETKQEISQSNNPEKNISISGITGNHNNFYINSYVGSQSPEQKRLKSFILLIS